MRTLIALLLIPAATAADDPPFVTAAKERQAKAKAFEVTLTVRKEWKGVTPIGSKERKDFEGIGTAKLAVDGDRFWYSLDVPQLIGMGSGTTRSHFEQAFDGSQIYSRFGSVRVNGPQAGQLEYTQGVSSPVGSDGWPDDIMAPLRWAFRCTERRSPPSETAPQMGWHESTRATGREEVIDGTRCIEVERVRAYQWERSARPLWLDATDYRPKRIDGTTIEYAPHPALGRVPSRWTTIPVLRHGYIPTRTTVTVDSFELRDSIPDERFVIKFPVASRVMRVVENRTQEFIVTEDGSMVPEVKAPPSDPPIPEPPTRSMQHSLWVVGGVVAVFVVLVVLLRRLAGNRTDDSPDSGDSPRLLT